MGLQFFNHRFFDVDGCPHVEFFSFSIGGPNEVESNTPGQSGMLHAEINALLKMDYNNPKNKKLYLTLSPCRMCAKAIVNAGINEVIFNEEYRDLSSLDILTHAGVKWRKI